MTAHVSIPLKKGDFDETDTAYRWFWFTLLAAQTCNL